MSLITFRPAELQDLQLLYDFEQGIITAERPFDSTLKGGHINYYDLKVLIESDEAEVIVAEFDKEIIASGYAQIREGKDFQSFTSFAYLGFMFVKPDQRGKGVISQLLERLKKWSQSKGITEIRLEVYNDNEPAVRAYEKAGFKKHMVEMRLNLKS